MANDYEAQGYDDFVGAEGRSGKGTLNTETIFRIEIRRLTANIMAHLDQEHAEIGPQIERAIIDGLANVPLQVKSEVNRCISAKVRSMVEERVTHVLYSKQVTDAVDKAVAREVKKALKDTP